MVEDIEQGVTLSVNAALIFEKDEAGKTSPVPTLVIKAGSTTTKIRNPQAVQHFAREVVAAAREFEEIKFC